MFELPCQQCWWAACSMSAVLVGFKLRIWTCPCCQAGRGLLWPFKGTGWAGGYSAAGLQGFGLLIQGRGLVSLLSGRRDNKKVFFSWKQAAVTQSAPGALLSRVIRRCFHLVPKTAFLKLPAPCSCASPSSCMYRPCFSPTLHFLQVFASVQMLLGLTLFDVIPLSIYAAFTWHHSGGKAAGKQASCLHLPAKDR